jgi:transcriptional regulator with XRE-family HTH domain
MSDKLILGKNIKTLRKRLGYTQFQLAELIGIHPNYISQIERCEKEPSLKILLRMRDVLEAGWADLLEETPDLLQKKKGGEQRIEREKKKILRFLDDLELAELKLILALIRMLRSKKRDESSE